MSLHQTPSFIDNIPMSDADTVVHRIATALTRRILLGELAQGTRLRQDALAYEFSVSQASIREAFRRLEMRRLVESLPRRGVRVTHVDESGEREIAAMRAVLEPLALTAIRGRVSALQLAAIRDALDAGDQAYDIYSSETANHAFHVALAAPCGMPRLVETIADLNLAYARHVFASERVTLWRARTNFDHARIFEAYAAARYDDAARMLVAHIRTVDRVSQQRHTAVVA